MSASAAVQLDYHDSTPDPTAVERYAARRAAINRANSQHSTGPRTAPGKHRSSRNALRHGLSAATAVLPSEDPAAYQKHCQEFRTQYQPANATEAHLVQELADTSWRLNRIPALEAALLSNPTADVINDIARLSLHSSRLSRQFQKALHQLRDLQDERLRRERHQLRDAAGILVHTQRKGIPWDPADDGFVFSKQQVERHARSLMRHQEAAHITCVLFGNPFRP